MGNQTSIESNQITNAIGDLNDNIVDILKTATDVDYNNCAPRQQTRIHLGEDGTGNVCDLTIKGDIQLNYSADQVCNITPDMANNLNARMSSIISSALTRTAASNTNVVNTMISTAQGLNKPSLSTLNGIITSITNSVNYTDLTSCTNAIQGSATSANSNVFFCGIFYKDIILDKIIYLRGFSNCIVQRIYGAVSGDQDIWAVVSQTDTILKDQGDSSLSRFFRSIFTIPGIIIIILVIIIIILLIVVTVLTVRKQKAST